MFYRVNCIFKNFNFYLLSFFCLILMGCTSAVDINLSKAEKLYQNKKYKKSLDYFKKVISLKSTKDKSLLAAKKAAEINYFHLKNYSESLQLFKYILINSDERNDQVEAQKKIILILFENFADYKATINEVGRYLYLLQNEENSSKASEEKNKYILILAKSYFYLNQFFQANVEAEKIVKSSLDIKSLKYKALKIQSDILISSKKYKQAIEKIEYIIKNHPTESQKDLILLNSALCYEKLNKIYRSVEILEKIKPFHPSPEFIEARIKRLKIRMSLSPGVGGLKK